MKMVHEEDVEELQLPGRYLKWLITPERLNAKNLSINVIRIPPDTAVKPAHSHPKEEEVIYIIRGRGRVMVDKEIEDVKEGTAVLFPPGSVHMLQNTGREEMKVICFFSPAADLKNYKFFDEVSFPEDS